MGSRGHKTARQRYTPPDTLDRTAKTHNNKNNNSSVSSLAPSLTDADRCANHGALGIVKVAHLTPYDEVQARQGDRAEVESTQLQIQYLEVLKSTETT